MRLALNSQVCITEMEFNDDRNGKRMHVNKKRKNYKAGIKPIFYFYALIEIVFS